MVHLITHEEIIANIESERSEQSNFTGNATTNVPRNFLFVRTLQASINYAVVM